MVVVHEPSDLPGRHEAGERAPILDIQPRLLLEDARSVRAHRLLDLVARQRTAVDATPVAIERMPDEEGADLETLLGEAHRGGEIATEAFIGRERRKPLLTGGFHLRRLPAIIQNQEPRLDAARGK